MSCATETYAPTVVGPRSSLCLFGYSGVARPRVTEREIQHARPPAPGGAQLTAAHVIPDSSKADPEHVWGDEGPVSE
jgi:hypothetical protein